MTWDLETIINFSGEPFECLEALIDFYEMDLENIQLEAYQGRWPNGRILAQYHDDDSLSWGSNSLDELEEIFNQYLQIPDIEIAVGLGLHGYGDYQYSPYPEFAYHGFSRDNYSSVRQAHNAMLLFGNHNAYRGQNRLPKSGRFIDTDLVVQTLEHVCRQAQPKDVYVLSQQQVCIPWSYHFIFHNTLDGYLQDLKNTLQLTIHGGDNRYPDVRDTYESGLIEDNPELMYLLYGGRKQEHIEFLQDFMRKYGIQLEEKGLPQTLTREDLEDTILDTLAWGNDEHPLMDFFFVGEGLGMYGKPLFPGYCEYFFMNLIFRFLNNPASGLAVAARW
jgi:hypothetical protein